MKNIRIMLPILAALFGLAMVSHSIYATSVFGDASKMYGGGNPLKVCSSEAKKGADMCIPQDALGECSQSVNNNKFKKRCPSPGINYTSAASTQMWDAKEQPSNPYFCGCRIHHCASNNGVYAWDKGKYVGKDQDKHYDGWYNNGDGSNCPEDPEA